MSLLAAAAYGAKSNSDRLIDFVQLTISEEPKQGENATALWNFF